MCAALGAIAIVLAVVVLLRGARRAPRVGLVAPGALVGVVSVAAMLTGATHVHSHAEAGHVHGGDMSMWPRPFDPTQPIDFSGVPGVSPEQQARAETLVASTLQDLPQFADVTKIGALGFTSIGDAGSGFEHYVNSAYLRDDAFLDPNKPESLVYQVDGDKRTLVAAMFADSGISLTDPELVGWGGPLMQWHVHGDLCWSLAQVVVGVTDEAGNVSDRLDQRRRRHPDGPRVDRTQRVRPVRRPRRAAAPARSPATAPASTSAPPPTTTAVDGRSRAPFGATTGTRPISTTPNQLLAPLRPGLPARDRPPERLLPRLVVSDCTFDEW